MSNTIQGVQARSAQAWTVCLWGNPKMTVICGRCDALFRTRDYIRNRSDGQAAARCPECRTWNLTGLYLND